MCQLNLVTDGRVLGGRFCGEATQTGVAVGFIVVSVRACASFRLRRGLQSGLWATGCRCGAARVRRPAAAIRNLDREVQESAATRS